VLTEAGLDPGIDHLLALKLIARARSKVGDGAASVRFTSYCGGLPAVPNAFRYRFSWAPRGVLGALRSPARYVDHGAEKIAQRPWEAVSTQLVGGEAFEAYPNRDSLPFVKQYGIPSSWRLERFVRGTLRLDGWSDAWRPVFDELRAGDQQRIDALADELAVRHAATDSDPDRVVLVVSMDVLSVTGESWSSEYVLDTVGDDRQSAMARCVSLPLSYGVTEILSGAMSPAGLRRAAGDAAEAGRWLTFLEQHGISCSVRTSPR
jgi:saccharopine dehydrogenase-like NADP-dependent oxidoreductase